MKPKTLFDSLPEAQFRLVVSLFLAQHEALSFHQKVICANDEVVLARKALGRDKASTLAMKRLAELSEQATNERNTTSKANNALMTALGMPVD